MTTAFVDEALEDLQQSFGLYIGLLLVYTISATAGSFTVAALPQVLFAETQNYLSAALAIAQTQAPSVFPVMLRALLGNLFCFLLISLASVRRAFSMLGVVAIAFCGLCAGFASRMLIVGFSARGALFSIVCIWAVEAILFPCRCKGLQLARSHGNSPDPKGIRMAFGLCIAIASLAVLCQCLASPLLVKWIHSP